jgi:gas vesicle protein
MSEEKSSNFLEGFLIGGLIGIGLGILFAPLSGEKIRVRIMDKLKELELDDILKHFSEAVEEGKQEAERAMRTEGGA